MFDPDEWQTKKVHWHGYAETRGEDPLTPFTFREDRLRQSPDIYLMAPADVVGWIATMTAQHALKRPVKLLGGEGYGATGDSGHVNRDAALNMEVACRGDSVYYSFAREDDRMHLWVEAVSIDECAETHEDT